MRNLFFPAAIVAAVLSLVSVPDPAPGQTATVRFPAVNGVRPAGPVEFAIPQRLDPDGNWTLRDPSTGGHYPLQILRAGPDSTTVAAILPDMGSNGEQSYQLVPYPDAFPQVMLEEDGDGRLAVRFEPHGKPHFVLNFGKEWAKPFIYPFRGLNHVSLTRGFPMDPGPDDATDHPHQKSFWSCYGDVNGVDFWHEGEGKGTQVVHAVESVSGPVAGQVRLALDWIAPDGTVLLAEEREYHFYNTRDDARIFDVVLRLTAASGPARFGETKEAGLVGLRVAPTMRGDRGGLLTGPAGEGEKTLWGKPGAWLDYSGPVDGAVHGVTLFDHPENPGSPARWHARNYGLLGCNNIARKAFDKNAEAADFVIPEGETRTFRYRVLVHRGAASDVDLDAYARAFSAGLNAVTDPEGPDGESGHGHDHGHDHDH